MPKKYVVTGGPGTGKTTTLLALSKEGYNVALEVARPLIERHKNSGGPVPWSDAEAFHEFQSILREKQMRLESLFQKSESVFLDRGVIDSIAYYKARGVSPPEELYRVASNNRYERVFVTEMLPSYKTDSARRENPKTARKIHAVIKETYAEFGYDVVSVPPFSVEKRVMLIKTHVQKNLKYEMG